MSKAIYHLGTVILLMTALMLGACIDSSNDEGTQTITQSESRQIAEDFVRSSPTFTFDGIRDSLKLIHTETLRCPSCWVFTFNFECTQAGYGNRAGQMLAQVITPHRAVITVMQGTVTTAHLDDKWDMMAQKLISDENGAPDSISLGEESSGRTITVNEGTTITITLPSNATTGFEWSLLENTDEGILQQVGHRYLAPEDQDPPRVGAGGEEVWTFRAVDTGQTIISLAYSRIWESVPPAQTFTLTVNIVESDSEAAAPSPNPAT